MNIPKSIPVPFSTGKYRLASRAQEALRNLESRGITADTVVKALSSNESLIAAVPKAKSGGVLHTVVPSPNAGQVLDITQPGARKTINSIRELPPEELRTHLEESALNREARQEVSEWFRKLTGL